MRQQLVLVMSSSLPYSNGRSIYRNNRANRDQISTIKNSNLKHPLSEINDKKETESTDFKAQELELSNMTNAFTQNDVADRNADGPKSSFTNNPIDENLLVENENVLPTPSIINDEVRKMCNLRYRVKLLV